MGILIEMNVSIDESIWVDPKFAIPRAARHWITPSGSRILLIATQQELSFVAEKGWAIEKDTVMQ